MKQIAFSGYSMYPSLRPGDTLVAREIPPGDVQLGDILCIPDKGSYVCHRIVHLEADGNRLFIRTKGDNLTHRAPPLEIGGGPLLKIVVVKRPGRGLVRPRFGKALALLSRNNMTYGIIRGKGGRLVRSLFPVRAVSRQPPAVSKKDFQK